MHTEALTSHAESGKLVSRPGSRDPCRWASQDFVCRCLERRPSGLAACAPDFRAELFGNPVFSVLRN